MYRKPYYCTTCRNMRWPGDCPHGAVVAADLSPEHRDLLKRNRCPRCQTEPFGCKCKAVPTASQKIQRSVAAAGLSDAWTPSDSEVTACWAYAQPAYRASPAIDESGSWVSVDWIAFHSPRYVLEHPLMKCTAFSLRYLKPYQNVAPTTVNRGKVYAHAGHKVRVQELSVDAGKIVAHYNTRALELFRDHTLAGVHNLAGDDRPMLLIRNRFGGLVGIAAPFRFDGEDKEWKEVG